MPKKVFIIHRYGGSSSTDWYAWLKGMLESRGFEVYLPEMPKIDDIYSKPWIETMKEYVKSVDTDTYFVGHDFGCFVILKYIDSLIGEIKIGTSFKNDVKVGGALLIAPYMISEKINFDKVKKSFVNITAIFAKDDPLVPESDALMLEKSLGAKVIVMPLKTHFLGSDGYAEMHAGLNELLKMANVPGAEAEGGPGEI